MPLASIAASGACCWGASGKQRHTKERGSAYVLAGANDDVVAATVRAAVNSGAIKGWRPARLDLLHGPLRAPAEGHNPDSTLEYAGL